MLWILRWMIVLGAHAQDVRDPSDRFAPPGWQGNPWGPAAARARAEGRLPAIVMTPAMTRWDRWGRAVLRDGDIVFRMGDSQDPGRPLPVQPVPRRRQRQPVLPHGDRRHRGRFAGRLRLHQGGHPPAAVRRLDPGQLRPVRREAAQARVASGDPRGARLLPEGLRAAGAVRLQLRPGRLGTLLPGDDGEGLPLPGPGPVRAGPARRHGERPRYPICITLFLWLSPLVLEQPFTLEQAVYMPGNGRHGVWASPLLEAVYSPPADRTIEDIPAPGRPIQPEGGSRDRRVHRERTPDGGQVAVATGCSGRALVHPHPGTRSSPPPSGRPRPPPPRYRGPGGQLLRRVPVLLARSEDGPELGRDPVPDPRPRLRPARRVRLGRAARSGLRVQLGPLGGDDRRHDRLRPAHGAGRPGRPRGRAHGLRPHRRQRLHQRDVRPRPGGRPPGGLAPGPGQLPARGPDHPGRRPGGPARAGDGPRHPPPAGVRRAAPGGPPPGPPGRRLHGRPWGSTTPRSGPWPRATGGSR